MTEILIIAPVEPSEFATDHRASQDVLAEQLWAMGHSVDVLAPYLGSERSDVRAGTGARQERGMLRIPVALPPRGRSMPRKLDADLFRRLPARLRGAGLRRPDLLVVSAVDASVIVARTLSILHGVPYLLLLDGSSPVEEGTPSRYEQLLAQSVQDASVVAASTPELAQELRARFTLPAVDVVDPVGPDAPAALASIVAATTASAEGPRMVFHAPYPLDPAPRSASRQRPNKMLAAFRENGQQVHRVTGTPYQRALGYRDLRRRIARGQRIEYAYSENSTQPNVLATSLRQGFAPLLEARIIAYCRRHRLPFGQFYRDVYWRFAESQASAPLLRRAMMQFAYRVDLQVLRRLGAHMFLPSLAMAPIVPFDADRSSALPPGSPVHDSTSPGGLELLYVGGIGAGYALDEGLRALQDVEQATLTMVVRRQEWEAHRDRYAPLLTERVRIVHAGSDELQELYDRASACLLLVAPDGYRRFAVPLKLFEYLGYGKPILASEGTLAGDMVDRMGSGFTVANRQEDIAELLLRLAADPGLLRAAAARARAAGVENTWSMRARKVAEVLTGREDA